MGSSKGGNSDESGPFKSDSRKVHVLYGHHDFRWADTELVSTYVGMLYDITVSAQGTSLAGDVTFLTSPTNASTRPTRPSQECLFDTPMLREHGFHTIVITKPRQTGNFSAPSY
jgi:hypothetical protein